MELGNVRSSGPSRRAAAERPTGGPRAPPVGSRLPARENQGRKAVTRIVDRKSRVHVAPDDCPSYVQQARPGRRHGGGGGQMAGLACSHENSRFINQSVNMRSIFTIVLLAWITLVRGEEMAGPSHVTCGSVVKLRNSQNGRHLHSLGVNYGSGSGQQAVVGTHAGDSSESMWVVRDDGSTPCSQGTPIQSGFRLRLQHAQTGKWLHSHGHKSPLSGNQEVSCFGSNQQSDPGDIWVVELKETKVWEQDSPVLIKHESTGAYLGSGKKEYGNPISGYSEMYAAKGKGGEHMFMATDGVYFS